MGWWDESQDTRDMFTAVWGDNAQSQWEQEHAAAVGGYNDPMISGPALGGSGGSTAGVGSSFTGGGAFSSPTALGAAFNVAQAKAQQKYLNKRLELEGKQFQFMKGLEKDKLAFEEAKQEFYQTLQIAQLTGMYEGSPTWQKTVQEAQLTGFYNGANTLERDAMENQTALSFMQLLAQLRGPQNAFQYAKVLSGTPQGLRDIVSAAAGKYVMPNFGGGDPNAPQQAASLQGLYQDASTGRMSGYTPIPQGTGDVQFQPVGTPNSDQQSATVSPPGAPAPTSYYNYEPDGMGGYNIYPPGIEAPQSSGQYSTPTPAGQQEQALSDAANVPLPLPNQWDPQAINRMGTYQKDLLLANYEYEGADPQSVWEEFQRSLPKAVGPKTGSIVWA